MGTEFRATCLTPQRGLSILLGSGLPRPWASAGKTAHSSQLTLENTRLWSYPLPPSKPSMAPSSLQVKVRSPLLGGGAEMNVRPDFLYFGLQSGPWHSPRAPLPQLVLKQEPELWEDESHRREVPFTPITSFFLPPIFTAKDTASSSQRLTFQPRLQVFPCSILKSPWV